jgi:ribosomal protein L7Ae-like RNA K-turn-binding protein
MPKKRKAAVTLDELDGVASRAVPFLRTDARAAVATASTSNTRRKEGFTSELEPSWTAVSGEVAANVLRHLASGCVASSAERSITTAARARPHVRLGRGAVCRGLRQGALSAVVLARESGPPLLYAHIAALAQEHGVTVALIGCSSAQLGQPFGLLRTSAIGLGRESFSDNHELVQTLKNAAGSDPPLPWLNKARATALLKHNEKGQGAPG